MKPNLLGGVAAIAMFAAAGGSTPAAAQEPFDWTGFYIGGHVGYGAADYDGGFDLPDTAILADDLDLDGFAGGGHVGFNYQFDSPLGEGHDLAVGIEADVSFVDWQDAIGISTASGDFTKGISGDVDLLWSIRARLGIAVDNGLVYATGGVAFSDADWAVNDEDTAGSTDFDFVGGVVGGGIEAAASDWLSVRLEGLYYIFNDRIDTNDICCDLPQTADFAEFDDAFTVRFGASIHLGGLLDAM